jgi:type IV pilus assembly protein PilW
MKPRATLGNRTARRRIRGTTLVEILVALALASLVIGAVALVFSTTSRNRADLERSARLLENAQYALDYLSDELRLAGYYAELSVVGVAWQSPDPCATALTSLGWVNSPFQVPLPLAGLRPTDAMPACLPNQRPGTAAFVVRRLDVDRTPPAEATGAPYLQVSKCALDARPWVLSSSPGDFVLRNLDCATVADVRQLFVRTYFVADCDDCGSDTIPTLKRAELDGGRIAVTPLVEGVENLQVAYGFDGNADGTPDQWLDGPDGTVGPGFGDPANVMAVRLFVLMRSNDSSVGDPAGPKTFNLGPAGFVAVADDGYRRVQTSSIVRLNNVAGPYEAP